MRGRVREVCGGLDFVECFVDAPLATAEARDPKGHYKKARAGEIKNFTGIDSPFEAPEAPELHLPTDRLSLEEEVAMVLQALEARAVVPSLAD